ncbi:MAG: TSUP family transporter [Patescibacteria group bacterium]
MNFEPATLAFLFGCFVWSGFTRTGFGFGANALMLPIALLVVPQPLVIIPVVAAQAIIFCGFEAGRNFWRIDWKTLGQIFLITILPFFAGLYGLIKFPDRVLVIGIYLVTLLYATSYIFNLKIKKGSKIVDIFSLILGGYVTGFSLSGGPPIVAVALKKIPKNLFRNSMLAFWTLVGSIKLSALALAGVDLQTGLFVFTLPAVLIGHLIGLRFHDRILHSQKFYHWLGSVLLVVAIIGIVKTFL